MIDIRTDDGTILRAAVSGPSDAPVLLLLHSIGCDHAMWAPQVAALRDRFRIVALDIRGHGASAAPDGDYTLELLGTDAVAVLDHLGARGAHVCGLSLGGAIAQWLAIHAAARVQHLVLANTAARIGSAQSWQARIDTVRQQGLVPIADMAMGRFFGARFSAENPLIVAAIRARLVSTAPAGYAGCCAALRDADLSARSGDIAAPTLLIAGADDVSTPPAQMQLLADGIPRARLLLLPAAHLSNLECPAEFTAAIAEHVAAVQENA